MNSTFNITFELIQLLQSQNHNLLLDQHGELSNLLDKVSEEIDRDEIVNRATIVTCYAILFVVSLIGNCLVIKIAFSNTSSLINVSLGNLAISDLLMTLVNMPSACARELQVVT